MRTQIVVENNILELTEELDAALTFAIDDVAKFAARNTAFSKTIVVPGSAENNFIFGNIFDVSIYNDYSSSLDNVGYNYNAAKSASCIIYQDNIQVLKGVIRVLEISIVKGVIEYECAVFGELGGLISNIGDKLLEIIDFSAEDHALNAASVTGSWAGSGSYYYPFIDYGYTWDGINFDVANLRPSIYAKSYFDKIFSNAGYTYSSSFISSDNRFNKLVIPNNSDGNYIEVTDIFNRFYSGSSVPISTDPYTVTYNTSSGTQYATESAGTVTYTRTQTINISVSGNLLLNAQNTTGSPITVTLRLYKNGADTGVGQTTTINAGATYNGTLELTSVVSLATSDTLKLVLTSSNFAGLTVKNQIASRFKGGSMSILKIDLQYGDNMLLNGQIPKGIKQIDFVTSLIKMFNLFISEDKDIDKELVITPQVDFYSTDIADAIDWTGKLDYNNPVKIKPLGELNSRSFEFKYKEDVDYYNELYKKKYGVTYGSTIYDTGLEFANDTATTELIFAPTVMVSVSGNNIIAPAIHKVENNIKKTTGSVIRILYAKYSPVTNAINLKNGVTTVASGLTSYPYAGHLDDPAAATYDLNWAAPNEVYFTTPGGYPSTGLFNTYWSGYIAEITFKDSKILTAYFNLSPVDILNLDFSIPIFIGGQLWRVNKVIDYNTQGKEMTKCELINVINLI